MAARTKHSLRDTWRGSKPTEMVTVNGFSILRSWEINGQPAPTGRKYQFLVRNPYGLERVREITVEVDSHAATQIARRTRGRVSPGSTFWVHCAERHLATYLEENADYPPDARLKVDQLTPDDLNLANWVGSGKVKNQDVRARLALFGPLLILLCGLNPATQAQQSNTNAPVDDRSENSSPEESKPKWQYGGFIDLGYLLDFNHPANRIFRSRGTTWHVDNVYLNMAGVYARKKVSEKSRWGVELTAQAGKDSEVFGFSATAPNIGGFKFLRHLGPTNVSYLAPVGKGLTIQGGIFSSLIGYDSLYAKDNFTYTRPWGADATPYLMMGANASYPFTKKVTGTFFVVNEYWHLAHANNVPSSGGQLAYSANPHVTVKQTLLLGPSQANISFKFWRFLSDSIIERKTDRVTFAWEYIVSSERVDAAKNFRAWMMAGQLLVHWSLKKRWSVTVRPEVFWDSDGRWTSAKQTVKAVTTTLEYRIPYQQTNTILRLEHRYDDSRGPEGGFFRGAELRPSVVGLRPTQHLLIFGLIFTFDH